ncbi:hypothetical protein ACFYXM_11795 [Streptomyces sp. NPDC002476]|uniref:hypothetical protein n=1 Tax=Streptomyces sp. NPDC002476 TaxID=3364648 RepID=UPI0036A8A024
MVSPVSPVPLEGFTGLEDTSAARAAYNAGMERWTKANPGQDHKPEALRLIALNDTLRRYNTLRPLLLREKVARQERDHALQQVESLWKDLGNPTAGSRFHTHQAYVRAVDDARTALDMWRTSAADAKKVTFVYDDGTRKAAYEQILALGYPPTEPLIDNPADRQYAADHLAQIAHHFHSTFA